MRTSRRSVAVGGVIGAAAVAPIVVLSWLLFRDHGTDAAVIEGLIGAYLAVTGFVAGIARWLWRRAATRAAVRGSTRWRAPQQLVARTQELDQIVAALCRSRPGMIGVHGPGGFGKTTLAHMALDHPRVRRRLHGEPVVISIGESVHGADLASKLNLLSYAVSGTNPTEITDPDLAGQHLARVLRSGPRRAVLLDDVWSADQLAPFAYAGHGCPLLVTTRIPGALPGEATRLRVDEMTTVQATALLTAGLSGLPADVVASAVAVTGRWPTLVEIVNKQLRLAQEQGQDVALYMRRYIDTRTTAGAAGLDVRRDEDRDAAVADAVRASLAFAPAVPEERFIELGVFAEDAPVPVAMIAMLWQHTAGFTEADTAALVSRLHQRSLLSWRADRDTVEIHDVVRGYQRQALGGQRLAEVGGALVDSWAAGLPRDAGMTAWWRMPAERAYLWNHICAHLSQAERTDERRRLVSDLRWVTARLTAHGAASVVADLTGVTDDRVVQLRRIVEQSAHLLAETDPRDAVAAILLSRLRDFDDWRVDALMLTAEQRGPHLVNRWPRPDVPDPAMQRLMAGHVDGVTAMAFGPDGLIATSDGAGTARLWDMATGRLRLAMPHRPAGRIIGFGDRVLLTSDDHWMRVWDIDTGKVRKRRPVFKLFDPDEFPLHKPELAINVEQEVFAVGAEDAVHLADMNQSGARLILTMAREKDRKLAGHPATVNAVGFKDSSTLAAGCDNGEIWLWDLATDTVIRTLSHGLEPVTVLAFGSSNVLAAGHRDGSISVWDTATGHLDRVLTGHFDKVAHLEFTPDGPLVSGGDDGTVRVWDITAPADRILPGSRVTGRAVGLTNRSLYVIDGNNLNRWDVATALRRDDGPRVFLMSSLLALEYIDDRLLAVDYLGDVESLLERKQIAQASPDDGSTRRSMQVVALSNGACLTADDAGIVRVRRIGSTGPTADVRITGIAGGLTALGHQPDDTLVTGHDDGTIRTYDLSGRLLDEYTGHTCAVTAIAFTDDGAMTSGDRDGTIKIWDGRTSACTMRVDGAIRSLAWHGTLLAVAAMSGCFLFTHRSGGTA